MMKTPQSFQVAAGGRGHVCTWEQIDRNCQFWYNLVITYRLINTTQIKKPQVEAEVKLVLSPVSFNWSGCCMSRTEIFLLSSVVCSGRTKGETFKSHNENWDPKSYWLLMKVRGRCFRCASETSLLFLNCPSCWWWMTCACATFWSPLGTKVVSSYFVRYLAWAETQIPLYLFPWRVVCNHTHVSIPLLYVPQSHVSL